MTIGRFSNSRLSSTAGESASECMLVVAAGDDRGWGEHATVTQAGNLVLEVAGHHVGDFAQGVRHLVRQLCRRSTPSILEVMSAAAFPSQRTLSTPHNFPANPTMEVMLKYGF